MSNNERKPGNNGETDGINHKKLLRYIKKHGGEIMVVDNKRLINGIPTPAKLALEGVDGHKKLVVLTGEGMAEKYDESDQAAIEKILLINYIQHGIVG